jgi:cell fate regulator YaaT (PSP1 superfamily)
MQKIVGVRFRPAGKIYYFDPQQIYLKVGEHVIVETARGLEYGYVASKVSYVEESELKHPIKPVVRKANAKGDKTHEKNLSKTEEAMELCKKQIEKHKLEMKLIRAEYTFDASKIIFYFTADGRVDFRELVKDLAAIFRIRIELRQIGVRDEAKMIGGLGSCGRTLCCKQWLGEFQPVSIKMAKEQGLSLNPGKISGICGRLLCCLQYEHEFYEDALKELPDVGERVTTPDGAGTVQKVNVLKDRLIVQLDTEEHLVKDYDKSELKCLGKKTRHKKNHFENVEDELKQDEISELEVLTKEEFSKNKYDEL